MAEKLYGPDRLREQLAEIVVAQVNEAIPGPAPWPGDTPIEQLFACALDLTATFEMGHHVRVFFTTDAQLPSDMAKPGLADCLFVVPQSQVGGWRVDFALHIITDAGSRWMIVECDGHDFHERTKDQAARDRSRDRRATLEGVPILRFTGAELWLDPVRCARETLACVTRLF